MGAYLHLPVDLCVHQQLGKDVISWGLAIFLVLASVPVLHVSAAGQSRRRYREAASRHILASGNFPCPVSLPRPVAFLASFSLGIDGA